MRFSAPKKRSTKRIRVVDIEINEREISEKDREQEEEEEQKHREEEQRKKEIQEKAQQEKELQEKTRQEKELQEKTRQEKELQEKEQQEKKLREKAQQEKKIQEETQNGSKSKIRTVLLTRIVHFDERNNNLTALCDAEHIKFFFALMHVQWITTKFFHTNNGYAFEKPIAQNASLAWTYADDNTIYVLPLNEDAVSNVSYLYLLNRLVASVHLVPILQ